MRVSGRLRHTGGMSAAPTVHDYDLVIVGTGSGNSIIGPEMDDWRIAIIERGTFGGTCLNVGCIPTKAWVQSAHAMKDATHTFKQLGVEVPSAALDFAQVQANKDGIVKGLVTGVGGLLKANGVAVVQGRGRFSTPNTIVVEGGDEVHFKSAIIATDRKSTRLNSSH